MLLPHVEQHWLLLSASFLISLSVSDIRSVSHIHSFVCSWRLVLLYEREIKKRNKLEYELPVLISDSYLLPRYLVDWPEFVCPSGWMSTTGSPYSRFSERRFLIGSWKSLSYLLSSIPKDSWLFGYTFHMFFLNFISCTIY